MQKDTVAVPPLSMVTISFDIWHEQKCNLMIRFREFGIQADTCRLVENNMKYAFDTPVGWTKSTEDELAVNLTEFM